MRFLSTRGPTVPALSLSDAIEKGLAPDGGLYVPAELPRLDVRAFRDGEALAAVATRALAPFFEGDALAPSLGDLCGGAFTFDAPTRWLSDDTALLELFHGPTAAFKDFGARFLAESMARLPARDGARTIVVATSGDTGAAVAAAFHRRPGFRVVILYPDGRVSPRQAHQLGAFGDNVVAFRVRGTFDDCQRVVKAAFADEGLRAMHGLGSANSISLGRLLPQLTYYALAAVRARAQGREPLNVVVPTGNLGNAVACLLAKRLGFPLGRLVLATNANRGLPDFLATGTFEPRPGVATLANAMDVGNPSNLERLHFWYPDVEALRREVSADWVDDDGIRATIRETWSRYGVAICPHTACGLAVLGRLRAQGASGPWLVAATAHPAKFETVVEPLVGRAVPPPAALAELLARPSHAAPLEAAVEALAGALRGALSQR